jgi:hypothetical protein
MKTIETKVYEFNELSDSAKEKARDWYREHALDYEWWEATYEDAARIGLKIKSFDLDRRHATGEFTQPAAHVAEEILKQHGETCETYKTAAAFVKQCKELDAKTPKEADGSPVDESTFNDSQNEQDAEFLKSLLEDYSIILKNESEYLVSDELVDESIEINEYTFTETGKRFG